jgi:hypothetical protein
LIFDYNVSYLSDSNIDGTIHFENTLQEVSDFPLKIKDINYLSVQEEKKS